MSVMEHAMHSARVVHRCRWGRPLLAEEGSGDGPVGQGTFLRVLAARAHASVLPVISLDEVECCDDSVLANTSGSTVAQQCSCLWTCVLSSVG